MENPQKQPLITSPASGKSQNLKERIWAFVCVIAFLCFGVGVILIAVSMTVKTCSSQSFHCLEQSCHQDYQSFPCTCTDDQGLVFCEEDGPNLDLMIAAGTLTGVAVVSAILFFSYSCFKLGCECDCEC